MVRSAPEGPNERGGRLSYFEFLLLLHVGGAIIGFGPTFAFSILGPMAGQATGEARIAILEAMSAIERRLVLPIALVITPLTGVLMIFEVGYDNDFFGQDWLVGGIVLYAIALGLALFVNNPAVHRSIAMAKAGETDKPEFAAINQRAAKTGMALTLILVVIIYLMVIKPGA
jgi:uncharacterized membrane protein